MRRLCRLIAHARPWTASAVDFICLDEDRARTAEILVIGDGLQLAPALGNLDAPSVVECARMATVPRLSSVCPAWVSLNPAGRALGARWTPPKTDPGAAVRIVIP